MSIPFNCSACGHIFFSEDVQFLPGGGSAGYVSITTNCIKCGGPASNAKGGYKVQDNRIVEFTPATPADRDMFVKMWSTVRDLYEAARKEDMPAEEILSKVEEISPELADGLRKRLGKGIGSLLLLYFLYWFLTNVHVELKAEADLNRLLDQAVIYSTQMSSSGTPPEPVSSQSAPIEPPQTVINNSVRNTYNTYNTYNTFNTRSGYTTVSTATGYIKPKTLPDPTASETAAPEPDASE